MRFERRFAATEDAAGAVLIAARAFVDRHVPQGVMTGDIVVVMAEAVNNVVEHAYCGVARQDMCLSVELNDEQAVIELRDRGRPIDGALLLRKQMPRIDGAVADLPEGGFGWPLIHALASGVRIDRSEDENRLRLTVPFQA